MVVNIMKILDYYYLVMLRSVGRRLDYNATGFMATTLTLNIFSLVALFGRYISGGVFWITIIIAGTVLSFTLNIIYNKERREKIIIEYKRESRESRQRGVLKVVLYTVLTFVFFIFAALMFALQTS